MTKTFWYWKGLLHRCEMKNGDFHYYDKPCECIFFFQDNRFLELRYITTNDFQKELKLNALTAKPPHENPETCQGYGEEMYADITVRYLEDTKSIIVEKVWAKQIPFSKAEELARKWLHANPYIKEEIDKIFKVVVVKQK